jgi:hypothetical protein
VSGCAIFKQSNADAYTTGRITAAMYLDMKDVQPENITRAAQISYRVLCAVNTSGAPQLLDSIISAEVAKAVASGESALFAELVRSQIDMATQNLFTAAIDLNGSETLSTLKDFQRGIDDVLAEYRK